MLRSRRPCSRPTVQRPLPGPPDRPAERRPRRPQADREERQARLDHGVDVGDQRRQRHAGLLGGEGRGEGEDVADDGVRAHLLQQRQQRPRRLGGVLALLGVGVGRREHPVFLGRGEAEPGALDRLAALLPGLDHDLVAARGERPARGRSPGRRGRRRRRRRPESQTRLGAEPVRAVEPLARSGEDDLRHVAVARGAQQEADRLAEVLAAGSSPRRGPGP